MIQYLALILGVSLIFYAAIPGIGAFLARGRWRGFRRTINEASRYPTADPRLLGRGRNAFVGRFRFFGTLEAIQGDDRIWVTNGRFSVAAELRNVGVYLLPEGSVREGTERLPDAADTELRSVPWNRIFSLPEGTRIFVAGALFLEDGRGVFRDRGKTRLLAVIHDCPSETIIQRAIWSGRHRNEFMNPFTLPSVVTGSLSLIVLAYPLLANPDLRIAALTALTAALAPISPFLPPGFPLYFAYRHYWKEARMMRAQRDVTRLPLRYFPQVGGHERWRATLLPDMEPYIMIKGALRTGGRSAIVSDGVEVSLPVETRKIGIRLPTLAGKSARNSSPSGHECVVFGAYREDGEGIALQKPEDPMAELVLVPGDPQAISVSSGRIARFYEIVSAVFIGLNVAVNVPLLLLLLNLLID